MITRYAKALFVAALALYFTVVVFTNITNYGFNFEFVKHVMSMDTTIPGNRDVRRAVTSPVLHHVFYVAIIAWEALAAVLLWAGAYKIWRVIGAGASEFNRYKSLATAGLTLALLLWIVAFVTVGGEWFEMFESKTWNAQSTALQLFAMNGIVLIFLTLPDTD